MKPEHAEQAQIFKDAGLLWWVNRSLHLFGWSIFYEYDDTQKIVAIYPSPTKWRGFGPYTDETGWANLGQYMATNSQRLLEELHE